MAQTFRVTSYALQDSATAFAGTAFTLKLRQALERNHFVVIQQVGAGDLTANNDRGPDANYCRVTADPFGTGDLAVSGAADEIQLTRGAPTDEWKGIVTVVECLGGALAQGFRLVDVVEVPFLATQLTKAVTCAGWDDIAQVGLYGGLYGGGAETTVSNAAGHQSVWAKVYPSGTDSVNLKRIMTGGTGTGAATFTVYVVEWGSEWSIQRANVNVASNTTYESAAISSVARANTFVLGFGAVGDQGIGDGWDGMICTLGNAQTQNANESQVTLATQQTGNAVDAEIYVHTHADLAVDFRGDSSGIPTNSLSGTLTVDAAVGTETYDNTHADVRWTAGTRFALITNTLGGTGNEFPRPQVGARPKASTTVLWSRSRKGTGGSFWVTVVDFDGISRPATTTLTPTATALNLAVPAPLLALSLVLAPPATSIDFSPPAPVVSRGQLAISPPPTGLDLQAPAALVGLGPLTISPTPAQMAWTAPAGLVGLGALTVSPPPAAVQFSVPATGVALGALTVSPSPAVVQFSAPVAGVALGALTLQPSSTSLALTVPAPAIALGTLHVQPPPAVVSFSAIDLAIDLGQLTLTPSPAQLSLLAPAITVDAGGIPITFIRPGPTILGFAAPAPTVIRGQLAIQPPATTLGLDSPPAVVQRGALLIAPSPTVLSLVGPAAAVQKTLQLQVPSTVLQLSAPAAHLISILLRPPSTVLLFSVPVIRGGPVETYRATLRAALERLEGLQTVLLKEAAARTVLEQLQVAMVTREHAEALGTVLSVSRELEI